MARRKRSQPTEDWLFPSVSGAKDAAPSSLLDVIDSVLNKGAVIKGDLVLGVANVDLIYAELSALLAAIDRVTRREGPPRKARGHEGPRRPRRSRRKGTAKARR